MKHLFTRSFIALVSLGSLYACTTINDKVYVNDGSETLSARAPNAQHALIAVKHKAQKICNKQAKSMMVYSQKTVYLGKTKNRSVFVDSPSKHPGYNDYQVTIHYACQAKS